jgi:hypothetical protein
MINLLPPEVKQGYHYAHHNLRLVRWVVMFGVGLVGLVIIATFGIIYMQRTTDTYTKQIDAANVSLQKQNLASTQMKVTEISNNLKLVVQVLSREVLFSQLLTRLGTVIPPNTILTNLSIVQTTGGIDISAKTADYQAATQLQVNLADPKNKIFNKADIVSINCTDTTTSNQDTKYPCTVVLRALFSSDNPFLFINSGKAKS